jgi:hypothetical protein
MIRLRFVTCDDTASEAIRYQAGTCVPFAPSHVEALSLDGQFYIGQHMKGGMQARRVGYDAGQVSTLSDGRKCDRVVEMPCTPEQEAAFYAFVHDKIGQPYDWISILGFVLTEVHLHTIGSLICSAVMSAALRTKGCEYLKWPMITPFHKISPRDLFLILSTHIEIPH